MKHSHQKMHISRTPMFYYDLMKILQGKSGQTKGRHRAKNNLQGKNDLTPDVLLCFIKVPFLTNHRVFLWSLKIHRASLSKISANTKLFFEIFVKLQLK